MDGQPLYDLTDMTGKKSNDDRTVVIGTIEMRWRVFIVGIAGLFIGMLTVMPLWPILGPYGIVIMIPLVMGFLFWLVLGRSRQGLQQNNYKTLLDRRAANLNKFMLGPNVIELPQHDWRMVVSSSQPNPYTADTRSVAERVGEDATHGNKISDTERAAEGVLDDIFGG